MHQVAPTRGFAPLSCYRTVRGVCSIAAWLLGFPAVAPAALEFSRPGFSEEVVAAGLPFPTAVAFTDDGRLFVALKSGVVRVWRDGTLLPTPFVDLSAQVNDTFDRGLLGLALHPDFPQQPYVYLLFTRDPPGVAADGLGARVARLVRVEADPLADHDVALPGMQQPQPAGCSVTSPATSCPGHLVLLGRLSIRSSIGDEVDGKNLAQASCMAGSTMGSGPLRLPSLDPGAAYPPGNERPIEDCLPADASTHTIGSVGFAADGSLFVSSGDGAGFNQVDPRALRSLDLNSLAGKLLRIDPATGDGLPGNPYFAADCPRCNRSRVWSLGLRNPFRFALDPIADEPVIGDVGWNTWEEINRGKGANFGWPCYEGGAVGAHEGGTTSSQVQSAYAANSLTAAACADLYARGFEAVRAPVFAYDHLLDGFGGSGGAAANAGAFYSGDAYPADLAGSLFLLDYSRRWIRSLRFDTTGHASIANFARESSAGMVQLIAGPDTNLYVIVYAGNASEVRRIRYLEGGNTPPRAVASATPPVGIAPLIVQFRGAASYDPDAQPLQLFWDFGDGTTSTQPDPSHVYSESGVYTATLRVREATAPFAEDSASIVLNAGIAPPQATITAPIAGTRFRVGESIEWAGFGRSGETLLPAADSRWELRLHHNEHVHFSPLGVGNQGRFVAEEHGADTYYEVCLTVALWLDVSDTQCVALLPLTSPLSVTSEPPGMTVVYEDEGGARTTPFDATPVVGSTERLTVPVEQQGRTFLRWSDGEASASRTLVIGEEPQKLTVIFSAPADACGEALRLREVRFAMRHGRRSARMDWLTLRALVEGELPNPVVHGLHLEWRNGSNQLESLLELPAGPDWQVQGEGWQWRGESGPNGRLRATLQPAPDGATGWRLRLAARGGTGTEADLLQPRGLRLTFAAAGDGAASCADIAMTGPPPLPTCRILPSARTLDCR